MISILDNDMAMMLMMMMGGMMGGEQNPAGNSMMQMLLPMMMNKGNRKRFKNKFLEFKNDRLGYLISLKHSPDVKFDHNFDYH